MYFRVKVKLLSSVDSISNLKVENLEVCDLVCERYRNRARLQIVSSHESTLFVMGFMDSRLVIELSIEQLTDEFLRLLKLDFEIVTISELTVNDFVSKIFGRERLITLPTNGELFEVEEHSWQKVIVETDYRMDYYKEYIGQPSDLHYEVSPVYYPAMENELSRIRQNKNPKFVGNPIHYLMKVDRFKTGLNLTLKLVTNQVVHKRQFSNRVAILMVKDLEEISLSRVFEYADGATLMIDLGGDLLDDVQMYELDDFMTRLHEMMHKYENRILFCVVYDNDEGRAINAFLDQAQGYRFVRIMPDQMTYDQAVELLQREAGKYQMDSELFTSVLDRGQLLFTEKEVLELFTNQQIRLMNNTFFPEYAYVEVNQKKPAQVEKGSAYGELMAMIGLDQVKGMIQRLIVQQLALPKLLNLGIMNKNFTRHMVFIGNPGTAKTTVARLLGRIMKDNMLLSSGHYVEAGRAELVAEYVGQTAVKVKKLFAKAKGGVLFLDEVYSLVDGHRGLFGDEAIATIVQCMENYRDDIVVIFAGYPQKMEDFLNINPGLSSRIRYRMNFKDYTLEELVAIGKYLTNEMGYQLSKSAVVQIRKLCNEAMTKPNFGNGRYVRNIIEEAITNHIYELFKDQEEVPTKNEVLNLDMSDFPEVLETVECEKQSTNSQPTKQWS